MTNSWTNDQGEPIMDGAAWRFEQQLDMDSQADYYEDRFYDNEPDEDAECDVSYDLDLHNGHAWCYTHDQNYDECEGQDEGFMMEDQHLDGSYEE